MTAVGEAPGGLALDPAAHVGQFVLSEDDALLPSGWSRRTSGGWRLATHGLPVLDVVDGSGRPLGWCLGTPVLDGVLTDGPLPLRTVERKRLDLPAVDALLERLAGRFLLVLLPDEQPTVLLDAYGALAAVHSEERRTVASVPGLIGGPLDGALAEETGFPHRTTWLPFGHTLTAGVRRLQADHALDLRTWRTTRHWAPPAPREDIDPDEVAAGIGDAVARTIAAVADRYPVTIPLTGGRDSRLLLACARDVLDRVTTFTFDRGAPRDVDVHLSTRLADRFGLAHALLPVPPAAAADERWLQVTGHALGGDLWRASAAMRGLDPGRVLLPGTAGEVGRARGHHRGDPEGGPVAPELLLRRLRIPPHRTFLEGAEEWLAGLPDLPLNTVVDLGYIEQRLSCWAGPGHYGNRTSPFELSPYSGRQLFRWMFELPLRWRLGEGLTTAVFQQRWPELLDLPFNRLTGARGLTDGLRRGARTTARSVLAATGRRR